MDMKQPRIECQYCFKRFKNNSGKGRHERTCPKRKEKNIATARDVIDAVHVGEADLKTLASLPSEEHDLDAYLDQRWNQHLQIEIERLDRLIKALQDRKQQLQGLILQ
jgi:hypothetical protein